MKAHKFVKGFTMIALATVLLAACGADDKKDTAKSSDSSVATSTSSKKEEKKATEKVAGGELKDGTYKLEEKNEENGYRAVFEMTVKDGKITKSDYDYVNADGKSKKDDADYNKSMKEKSGTDPEKYIPALNEELVKVMNEKDGVAGDVEVVTGATHSSHSFIIYAEQLINAAQKGDTAEIVVDNIVTK